MQSHHIPSRAINHVPSMQPSHAFCQACLYEDAANALHPVNRPSPRTVHVCSVHTVQQCKSTPHRHAHVSNRKTQQHTTHHQESFITFMLPIYLLLVHICTTLPASHASIQVQLRRAARNTHAMDAIHGPQSLHSISIQARTHTHLTKSTHICS